MKARVIALYLPQYHPIAENDRWWGKGFTEWTNVGKARPLFRGHYQPRVPADLGYYDLRLPVVRQQQADMARAAGVEGFCYWHYWFGNGRELLSEIFDEVLASGQPDFPFCLGWANHSWTRRTWNTTAQYHRDQDLIAQEYPGHDDIVAHFNRLLTAFRDRRYITVEGKPLFFIYRPGDIPDCPGFLNTWRGLAVNAGLPGLHFVGFADGWESNFQPILDLGVDAISPCGQWTAQTALRGGYLPMMVRNKLHQYFPRLAPLDRYSYRHIIQHLFSDWDAREDAYPQIIPNWDRSPRGGRRAVIYTGSTPGLFRQHVEHALELVAHKEPEHRVIILRSWNEWAEGNYMEPDLRFGHGYLDALRDALS